MIVQPPLAHRSGPGRPLRLGAIRPGRPGLWTFTAIVLAFAIAVEAAVIALVIIPAEDAWSLGMDYRFYRDIGLRWLTDGVYYRPYQLAGPYAFTNMLDVLYPPQALLLFAPFAYLPAPLWWAVPLGVTAAALWGLRPRAWAWVVMLLLLAWPRAIGAYLFGNSDIWVMATIAAGARWGWPAALLVLKPTALPFMLPAIRRRSFWIALGILAGSVVVMAPLMAQYVTAMRNLTIDRGYALGSLALYLVPIVAYVGRDRAATPIPRPTPRLTPPPGSVP